MNVDEENVGDISEIIDEIPEEYRSRIGIAICNIFQNEKRISTFDLYKQALKKGYVYSQRWNQYVSCHACLSNATVIDTDGSILLCSNTSPEEKRMGYLRENGQPCTERVSEFYNLRTITARDNPECKECIELPFCIAGCKYARLKDNTKCLGKNGSGLSLRERALLDYYSDLQKEMRRK